MLFNQKQTLMRKRALEKGPKFFKQVQLMRAHQTARNAKRTQKLQAELPESSPQSGRASPQSQQYHDGSMELNEQEFMYQNLANYNFNNNQTQDCKSDNEIVSIFPARPQNSKGTARFLRPPPSKGSLNGSGPPELQTSIADARSSLPTNPNSLGPLSEAETYPSAAEERLKLSSVGNDLRKVQR